MKIPHPYLKITISAIVFLSLLVYARKAEALNTDPSLVSPQKPGHVLSKESDSESESTKESKKEKGTKKEESASLKETTKESKSTKKEIKKDETDDEENENNESEEEQEINEKTTNRQEIKFEVKNGKVKAIAQDGTETELPDNLSEESIKIEDKSGKGEVELKAIGDNLFILKSKSQARTKLPISVNTETSELTVTTPKGTKVLTILPDKAIEGMIKAGIIDQSELSTTQQLESFSSTEEQKGVSVELTTSENGRLVYKVNGTQTKRVFGIFPVKFEKTAEVSAETGEVMQPKESTLNKILNLLSF